jgi:guanine deaminase
MNHEFFMREAIALSRQGSDTDQGGPFGAVIVLDREIVGRGHNRVLATNDPTAHAEVVAIREATGRLGRFHLETAVLYTSCEPCPMCLGAIYWAKIGRIFYGNTRSDAAAIGFSDDLIYRELGLPLDQRSIPLQQISRDEALAVFRDWSQRDDIVLY